MAQPRIFHGTDEEAAALIAAIGSNCACVVNDAGELDELCQAHRILNDQHMLDWLVFMRRSRQGFTPEANGE